MAKNETELSQMKSDADRATSTAENANFRTSRIHEIHL